MKTLRAFGFVMLFGCVGGFCAPSPTPPVGDSCTNPSMGQVATAALATARIDGEQFGTGAARDELPPRLLDEGAPLWLVRGGQGADMVGVRLVFTGSDVPKCIAQDTQVTVGGKLAARNHENVVTYPLDGGGFATKTVWLPGAFSGAATVTTDVAGLTLTRSVNTTFTTACAGSTTCPCASAYRCVGGEGQCIESLGASGAALWQALVDCRRTCDAGGCDEEGGACATQARACSDDLY